MENNNTGLAGEFFVAAELLKRDFQVALTLGNAKEVDLLVRSPNKEKETFSVQVKTLRDKNCFDLKVERILKEIFYVFVFLNNEKKNPDYFILTGTELLEDKESFYGASLNVTRPTVNYGPLKPHKSKWEKFPR